MSGKSPAWEAYQARSDLSPFGSCALLLFALQLKFDLEDIALVATNSLTEGGNDKKVDLVYIDTDTGRAVLAQTYIAEKLIGKDGNLKTEAPANKASDLNTAVSWLLSRPLCDLPEGLRSHAEELRQAINNGLIQSIHIWYVHNLPESANVRDELTTVENTANSCLKTYFPGTGRVEIQSLEVGTNILEEWYRNLSTPILVTDEFNIPISGGFEISEADWTAFVTSIPAKWLYRLFQEHKTKLFSANVREYLGSRSVDKNINNGIKDTAHNDPGHFWVYNNGITALVHEFEPREENGSKIIHFRGISIINGAQTVGAIGNLESEPIDDTKVLIRFIMCNNSDTVYDVVRFNNSQNKITAPDFRSSDSVQRRLLEEFKTIPSVVYMPRRGGHEDTIKRNPNVLPSVTAGQVLAAFHDDPGVAYHEKTHMWEDDKLYSRYFNEQTSARHIIFAYSLLRSIESKKIDLWDKSGNNGLIEIEKTQLNFYRKRGSTFLMTSAIAKCLEIILDRQITNRFKLSFKKSFISGCH